MKAGLSERAFRAYLVPMPHRPRAVSLPHPPIALALGGGGARGLAHIVALEVLDELGLRPSLIVGTSMGAIIGAAYAAGLSGRDIREHVTAVLRDKNRAMARVLQARVGRFAEMFSRGLAGNPVMLDGEKVLDLFWPEAVPDTFEDLAIPFSAVATDYHARETKVFDAGPLVTGVAASMAIPGLIQPVQAHGRVFIDGGVVNPLPFDLVCAPGRVTVAVDVSGGPNPAQTKVPGAFEAMIGSAQIMQHAIVGEKLRAATPDVLVQPAVGSYSALDFFKSRAVLEAAEAAREGLKRDLATAIEAAARITSSQRRSS
jgi:NTE family protein